MTQIIPTNDLERLILSHLNEICDGLQEEARRFPFDTVFSYQLVRPNATAVITIDADFENEYHSGQRFVVCTHIGEASIEAWDDDENELSDTFETQMCKAIAHELSRTLLWKEVA